MKKLLLLALLFVSILPTYSQTAIGVIGGYNATTIYPEHNLNIMADDFDASFTSGWRAGLITEHHLGKKFYLQPQLILNQKGFQYSYSTSTPSYYETNRRLLYLELQANVLFKQPVGKGKLYVGAGHYIGRGITGRERVKGYYEQDGIKHYFTDYYFVKYRNKLPTYDPNYAELNTTYVRPYDLGINFIAGYELKNGLFFNATYSTGLLTLGYYDKAYSNFYVGLTVGYFLKRSSR